MSIMMDVFISSQAVQQTLWHIIYIMMDMLIDKTSARLCNNMLYNSLYYFATYLSLVYSVNAWIIKLSIIHIYLVTHIKCWILFKYNFSEYLKEIDEDSPEQEDLHGMYVDICNIDIVTTYCYWNKVNTKQ
jgi:hypothetical protein